MKRQLTEFPEGWALGEPEIATFRKYNPSSSDADIALQWEKFEAHHLSLGSVFKLWPQAWRTWAVNQKLYGFRTTPQGVSTQAPRQSVFYGKTGMDNLMRNHSGSRRDH